MFIKIVYCFLCFADMLIYLGLFGVCSLLDKELNLKKPVKNSTCTGNIEQHVQYPQNDIIHTVKPHNILGSRNKVS